MFKYSAEELLALFAIASSVGFFTGFLSDEDEGYYLAYFIGMAITFVLGLLVLPIVHYVVKENEKEKQAEEERKRIEEEEKRQIEENIKNLKRQEYIEQYNDSSIINSIADRLIKELSECIDSIYRYKDNKTETFERKYEFHVCRTRITSNFDIHDIVFEEERYEPLLEEEQRYAVAHILKEKVLHTLIAKYPKAGFPIAVEYEDDVYDRYMRERKMFDDFNEKYLHKPHVEPPKGIYDYYRVTIYFHVSNPNYVEAQQW